MQFVSACSQANNCRARFGHWWLYFLRMAWNCTPASACWRKNCPWSTQNAVFCRLSISWCASGPRHGGDAGSAMSQDMVASGVQALLAGSVAGPAQVLLASSHWAPPCWHTPLPSVVSVLRCAYGYIAAIASPFLPLEDNSSIASNAIPLNSRGTFPLLNTLVCSASLSRGKQVYKSATSLFWLLHVHPPHFHALRRGVRHSLTAQAAMDWPNFLQSATKAIDINFKGKQLPFIITHGFSSTSFK